ncbi:MAG: glycosyltransferase [Planctomycetota bacterium]
MSELPDAASVQSPLRVAHAIEGVTSQAGGPTTAFLSLVEAVGSRPGVEVRAFAPAPPADDPIRTRLDAAPEGRFHLTPPAGRLVVGGLGRRIHRELRAGSIDVLHLHGLWCRDYLPLVRRAERCGVPLVFHPHGMLIKAALERSAGKKKAFLRLGLERGLARSSLIVCATDDELATSWVPSEGDRRPQTTVIPLPVEVPSDDPEALRSAGRRLLGVDEGTPLVVFLGRLHEVKRLDLLVDAVARVPDRPTLALVGEGETPEDAERVRDRARTAGLEEDRLKMPGWVNGPDKWAALGAADAVVLCSVHENFGYTIPEAAAVGVAGVMTPNLSLAEELAREGGGFVGDATPEGLARALERAIAASGPEARPARRDWVVRRYSSDAVGSRLVEAYRACRPSGPSP